jgi:hypothetical protein
MASPRVVAAVPEVSALRERPAEATDTCWVEDDNVRRMLPLACTLGPAEGAARLARWREIGTTYGAGQERGDGCVLLRFRDDVAVATELADLIDAERSCCAFLGWNLERSATGIAVRITGSADAVAPVLFAQ